MVDIRNDALHISEINNYQQIFSSVQGFTECDLFLSPIPGVVNGPGRLSTQADNGEPAQIQPLREWTPLNSLSSTVLSSTEVFLVDGVVVMFAGLSTGEVREVGPVSCMCCGMCPLFSM